MAQDVTYCSTQFLTQHAATLHFKVLQQPKMCTCITVYKNAAQPPVRQKRPKTQLFPQKEPRSRAHLRLIVFVIFLFLFNIVINGRFRSRDMLHLFTTTLPPQLKHADTRHCKRRNTRLFFVRVVGLCTCLLFRFYIQRCSL